MPSKIGTFKRVANKKYDGMMGRCYRESDPSYKNYGAKNIRVCAQWIKDINSFRYWLLGQLDRLNISEEEFVRNSRVITLDRINGFGHYEPSNCRLSCPQSQSRNGKNRKKKLLTSSEGEKIYV